jgi:hypothetical protein
MVWELPLCHGALILKYTVIFLSHKLYLYDFNAHLTTDDETSFLARNIFGYWTDDGSA